MPCLPPPSVSSRLSRFPEVPYRSLLHPKPLFHVLLKALSNLCLVSAWCSFSSVSGVVFSAFVFTVMVFSIAGGGQVGLILCPKVWV